MNQPTLAAGAILFAFGLGLQSPDEPRETAMTPQRAGLMFAEKCASCHVAADPAFASDRAWIGQLRETA